MSSSEDTNSGAVVAPVEPSVRPLAERLRDEATKRRDMLLIEAALALETKDAVILRLSEELRSEKHNSAEPIVLYSDPTRIPRLGDPGESVLGW